MSARFNLTTFAALAFSAMAAFTLAAPVAAQPEPMTGGCPNCQPGFPCAMPTQANTPQGWKVELRHQALSPKQGNWTFIATVRDAAGQPVNDARVFLKKSANASTLAPMSRSGAGEYWTTSGPGIDNPDGATVVVQPGAH